MRIETIRIKNFKVLQNLKMKNIPQLCIIVGANGTGKSILFDVFGFIKDCLIHNVRRALQVRGGFSEVLSRNAEQRKIEIEIQFRLEIAGKERLVTYILSICKKGRKIVIDREILRYKRGAYGSPFHFLDFSNGKGFAITNEEDFSKTDEELHREEQDLDATDILAVKGLGQFDRFKAANAFRKLIENWHVSDFHISAARGSKIDRHVSDGTIKMFAYLVLLYDPSPHPVLCVEEPENQLYVNLMPELAEEFRSYAHRGGQVFVSTHSPDFLNAAQLEEVFWLKKRNGYSQVLRAKDDSQLAAFMAEGDQMGYLWKQGLFEGIDP